MPGTRALALLCAADLVVALDGMVVMVALKGLASGLFQTSTHPGGAFVLTVLATAAAVRTGAALDAGEPAAAALTSGFALAFAVAAGILAIGAITANRTLPARG